MTLSEIDESSNNVAVAIARREKQKKQKKSKQQRAAEEPIQQPKQKAKSTSSDLKTLLHGAALYGVCLALPTFLGVAVRFYEDWWEKEQRMMMMDRNHQDEPEDATSSYYEYYSALISSYGNYAYNVAYNTTSSYLCQTWSWYTWCPPSDQDWEPDVMIPKLTAPDISSPMSDVKIITILSLSLAFVRITLVHWLVPLLEVSPQQLEVMVRCKSSHLLSSSYPLTPHGTPSRSSAMQHENAHLFEDEAIAMKLGMPPLYFGTEQDEEHERESPQQQPQQDDDMLRQPQQEEGKEEEEPGDQKEKEKGWLFRGQRVLSKLSSSWSAASRRALGHRQLEDADADSTELTQQDFSSSGQQQQRRLFAAPRYATAVFRLLYSISTCTAAMVWFRHANFWPRYLGGYGSTKNCWDLKGSAIGALDTDFDDMNDELKWFFLVQASYHLHSLCFHFMSMVLLALYNNNKKNTNKSRKIISMKSSLLSYARSLVQHMIASIFVGTSYFFSSLRRLGAIGMFAFDFSSIFLHLLQLCINAPSESILRKVQVVQWIHRGLVVPTFLYTRFFVLPFIVWYSAAFESKDWLQQMERTLFPGCARAATIIFHVLLTTVLVLNLVLFRRLLFHPHLARIAKEQKQQQAAERY